MIENGTIAPILVKTRMNEKREVGDISNKVSSNSGKFGRNGNALSTSKTSRATFSGLWVSQKEVEHRLLPADLIGCSQTRVLSWKLDDDPPSSHSVDEWGGISKSGLEAVCTRSCLGCWAVCPLVGPLKAPAGVWSCFSGACCDGGLIRLTVRTFSDNCATDSWRAFHLLTQLPVRAACSRVTGCRFNYQRPELNHHQIPTLDSPGSFIP